MAAEPERENELKQKAYSGILNMWNLKLPVFLQLLRSEVRLILE